ncbi:hypothetical protein [Kineosporia succinea]|uniref:Uncharacterized protein n=1 Tax=Kineosporia succinea TaxID=84632 RepID=A0ABT9P1S9_9ACTN|nr:hypothetical protein [Kineosporia succinea]MDP9826630.1 hypothetical protein [Kineosporia succinea]
MSVKRISLAVAAVALGAGALTAVGSSAQALDNDSAAVSTPAKTTSYAAIPAKATDSLGFAKTGLEFGYVTRVSLKNDKLRITVKQAEFYDGKAAKLLNGGITPPNDWFVAEDESLDTSTYTVAGKASLIGAYDLLGQPDTVGRKAITAKQLAKNFSKLETKEVPVWLRHTDTSTNSGPVTALAEQFIP